MRSARHVLIATLVGVVILSGCRSGTRDIGEGDEGELLIGQAEVSETTTRGVNPGNRTLVIAGFNGVVELTGTSDATAQLEFTKRARGRNDAAAREGLAGISVDEAGADDAYRFTLDADRRDRSAVDVRGTVPVGTPLRIELSSGTVAISAADGPVDVNVQNGTVRIGGTSRDVRVDVQTGDINVETRMVQPDGMIRLETANGNVTLRMPATTSARVDARTSVGSVNVEGLDFSSRRLQRDNAGASFSGQLGAGNARVDLRVQNGVIRLVEGQTLQLDGLRTPQPPANGVIVDSPPAADTLTVEPDTAAVREPVQETAVETP